jgi:hypothetical protein
VPPQILYDDKQKLLSTLHDIRRSLSHIIHRVSENLLTIKWNETTSKQQIPDQTLVNNLKDT